MKPSIILSLIATVSCIMVLPASSGTWSDGSEDEEHEDWRIDFPAGPTILKEEEGILSVEVHSQVVSYLTVIDSDLWQDYTFTAKVKIMNTFGSYVDGGIFIRAQITSSLRCPFLYLAVKNDYECNDLERSATFLTRS